MKNLILVLMCASLYGCTINFVIETDFAAQSRSEGTITEEVTTEATTTSTPEIEANVTPGGF